jgi:hypothetical protein
MSLSEVEAKFHVLTANLPEPRRADVWAMRARMTETTLPFADLLALIHPAPGAPHG